MLKAFEWNGARFVVRPLSGLDQELYSPLLVDVATAICNYRGIDIDNLPRTLDKLIVMFVRLAQVTTIEGDNTLLHDCNLITGDIVTYFNSWVTAITTDQTLYSMWQSAYEGANRVDDSPLPETPAPQTVSD